MKIKGTTLVSKNPEALVKFYESLFDAKFERSDDFLSGLHVLPFFIYRDDDFPMGIRKTDKDNSATENVGFIFSVHSIDELRNIYNRMKFYEKYFRKVDIGGNHEFELTDPDGNDIRIYLETI